MAAGGAAAGPAVPSVALNTKRVLRTARKKPLKHVLVGGGLHRAEVEGLLLRT